MAFHTFHLIFVRIFRRPDPDFDFMFGARENIDFSFQRSRTEGRTVTMDRSMGRFVRERR